MSDRAARLAALLAQPERSVEARHDLPGLLKDVTPETLGVTAEHIISTQAAGAALQQARRQRELSLRGAGEITGRSAPRVKAIEATDVDIHLGTVVEHARALGYAVSLTLTPTDGAGPHIIAELTHEESASDPSTVRGEIRLKPKTRVRQ